MSALKNIIKKRFYKVYQVMWYTIAQLVHQKDRLQKVYFPFGEGGNKEIHLNVLLC